MLREFLEHGRVEEKPDTMSEEEICLRCQNDQVKEISWILKVTLKVERAKLWDEEFKVISKGTIEIWIYSALFKIFNCIWLMSIQPDHVFGNLQLRVVSAKQLLVKIKPLFESLDKGLLCDCLGFLTEEAAAECIIEATTGSE